MLTLALPLALLAAAPVPKPGAPIRLPAHIEAGRIFLEPITKTGAKLTFLGDTGGGLFIRDEAVKRLKLKSRAMDVDGQHAQVVPFPDFKRSAWIPPPPGGVLPEAPKSHDVQRGADFPEDGLLGMAWFADRVWTIDYPKGRMWLRAKGDLPKVAAAHVVKLHFPEKDGVRQASFPRIQARIDGQPEDLLLDTGASGHYSAEAAKAAGGPADRATSFITTSTLERWHQDHPDWPVYENGDVLGHPFRVIRVPSVEIAGFTVGPVFFTERPDKAFHVWMSQWMDKTIDGALGGSALKYLRVTLDYPGAQALFERP